MLTEPNAALLLGANFLSEIGDWFNTVALISLSYRFSDGVIDNVSKMLYGTIGIWRSMPS